MSDTVPANALELLRQEVSKILGVETVEPTIGIGELGIDSLNVVELIVFCEQLYGAIDPEALTINQYTTLTQLDEQLREQVGAVQAVA